MRRVLRFTFTVRRAATGQPALPPVTVVVEDVGPDPDRVDEALRGALVEERPPGWRVVRLPDPDEIAVIQQAETVSRQ
jgi:hypothetical protein